MSYRFEGGYPTQETIERAYDDIDLNRAVAAYRFFYPSVSGLALFRGGESVGQRDNEVFGQLETTPEQIGFTLNSDTPYGPIPLDLRGGPLVVEVPAGPLVGAVFDLHQNWVADIGIPGPEAGQGGKHLILPPGWDGAVPDGFFAARSTANRVLVGLRAIPADGDVQRAIGRLAGIKVRPLDPGAKWAEPSWLNFTGKAQDMSPLTVETGLGYWRALHEILDSEPPVPGWEVMYGELAALGIVTGVPFAPDERMTAILEDAARTGNAQLRVQAFANRRPDGIVWPGLQWQWPVLRPENGSFDGLGYLDEVAREVWFFQAIAVSPAMFRRTPGGGSLYWLGLRDADGAYLDGGKHYTLSVPQPVPAKLFWSVTVYDAETRSQIRTPRNQAALRSLFELAGAEPGAPVQLHFGPEPPAAGESHWIQTIPGRGWFTYFRIYGPDEPAFDGSWRLPDFART